jgi:hypothetical protein
MDLHITMLFLTLKVLHLSLMHFVLNLLVICLLPNDEDHPGSAFPELLNTDDALDKYQQVSEKVIPLLKLKVNPFDFNFTIERNITLSIRVQLK